MSEAPDRSAGRQTSPARRLVPSVLLALLVACSSAPPPVPAAAVPQAVPSRLQAVAAPPPEPPAPLLAAAPAAASAAPLASAPGAAPALPNAAGNALDGNRDAATTRAVLELLAFHERVREMTAAELAREAARLGDAPATPRTALLQAIVLAQTHGPGDLLRALSLVEPIARATHPAVAPWQPFARWLATRYAEQRRLEEQVERQAQLLRETQRRLDQLNDKLSALRGIERSLGRSGEGGSPRPTPGATPRRAP